MQARAFQSIPVRRRQVARSSSLKILLRTLVEFVPRSSRLYGDERVARIRRPLRFDLNHSPNARGVMEKLLHLYCSGDATKRRGNEGLGTRDERRGTNCLPTLRAKVCAKDGAPGAADASGHRLEARGADWPSAAAPATSAG